MTFRSAHIRMQQRVCAFHGQCEAPCVVIPQQNHGLGDKVGRRPRTQRLLRFVFRAPHQLAHVIQSLLKARYIQHPTQMPALTIGSCVSEADLVQKLRFHLGRRAGPSSVCSDGNEVDSARFELEVAVVLAGVIVLVRSWSRALPLLGCRWCFVTQLQQLEMLLTACPAAIRILVR